jgi:acetylglutamate kinase
MGSPSRDRPIAQTKPTLMEQLLVIKIGGNVIDNEAQLQTLLQQCAALPRPFVLIHGGGKLATQLAETMGIPQQMVDGRRITDAASLKVVTMVYAGYINKTIVAQLQALDCNALGLCGADGNTILAHKREHPTIDYGFVGDVDAVNAAFLAGLLQQGQSVVMAPITHNGNGQLLNTNADTIAQEIAKALSQYFAVQLLYTFEKPGVLLDANNDNSVIPTITPADYQQLKAAGKIFAGMIPKLDNAFAALQAGVQKVIIGQATQLDLLIQQKSGTTLINQSQYGQIT